MTQTSARQRQAEETKRLMKEKQEIESKIQDYECVLRSQKVRVWVWLMIEYRSE
jgi:hypothetical protein